MNQPTAGGRQANRPEMPVQHDVRNGIHAAPSQTRQAVENRTERRYSEMPVQRRTMSGEPQTYNRSAYGNPANGRPAAGNVNSTPNRPTANVSGVQRMPRNQNVQRNSGSNAVPNPRVRQQETGTPVRDRQTPVPNRQPQMAGGSVNPQNAQNRVRTTPTPERAEVRNRALAQGEQRRTGNAEQAAVSRTPKTNTREKAKLSRTRVTDISSLTKNAVEKKEKKVKPVSKPIPREKEYSDEGGNTVVSVVKAVIYMIFVVVISVFLALAIILVGNDVFAFVKSDVVTNVTIPEDATFEDITEILYENNIITYPEVFKLYGKLKKEDGPYVAGDFLVSPMTNYGDLMDAFKPKPKSGTSRITIPEGYTTDEIIDLMVSYGIGTREGYEDVIQNYDFDYWFLDELEETGISEDRIYRLDGYLFPDTYDFYNSSSEVTVINKLLKRFDQLFTNEYRKQCEVMGYSVDDIITLASLIEKEAGTAAEFFNVSSVFHNRLSNAGYYPCLESDATIVYAIHHETGERPKSVNTSYETPYNTYFYKGLPPGPIANPSASAILAALSPAKTQYFFFVSDGSTTYFSETKTQHDQYIAEIKAKNQ